MYSITKPTGRGSIVTLTNDDSNISVNLGIINSTILNILNEDKTIPMKITEVEHLTAKWNFHVTYDTASALIKAVSLTAKTTKSSTTTTEVNKSKSKTTVDAMDVMFGIASY